ncbi:hypothetical protein B0T18DRAFT_489527, partial [Schizothecium vesticola]
MVWVGVWREALAQKWKRDLDPPCYSFGGKSGMLYDSEALQTHNLNKPLQVTQNPTSWEKKQNMTQSVASELTSKGPTRTAFLSLPGLCTGDLWHTAAAGLLLRQRPFPADVQYPVLITLPEDARRGIANGHVSAMYEYLTHLGLSCVVAKLPEAGPSADDEHCERIAAMMGPEEMGELLASQNDTRAGENFQNLWASLSPLELPRRLATTTDPRYILPPVHHYAATSILAIYFQRDLAGTHVYLRQTMTGDLPTESPTYQEAHHKVQKLRELVAKKRHDAGPGYEHARAILFIYRSIDQSPSRGNEFIMNPHQNASHDLFDQVQHAALQHGFVTVRVPHGLPAYRFLEDDLDLFDVKSLPDGPLKHKNFTAMFWAQ